MRTLAPIRVRKCTCRERCQFWLCVCRFCGDSWGRFTISQAVRYGLGHLRSRHPWPWADLDNDNRSEA